MDSDIIDEAWSGFEDGDVVLVNTRDQQVMERIHEMILEHTGAEVLVIPSHMIDAIGGKAEQILNEHGWVREENA